MSFSGFPGALGTIVVAAGIACYLDGNYGGAREALVDFRNRGEFSVSRSAQVVQQQRDCQQVVYAAVNSYAI